MKISRLLLLLCFLLQLRTVNGQGTGFVNSFAVPSANNTFLGLSLSNTDIGVDLYSGTAQVSIPLCMMPSKEFSVPVSLTYTGARGIRVQDYASFVGLGWQLNAGGAISRVLKSFPDEQPNGYIGTGLWGQRVAAAAGNISLIPNEIQGTMEAVPTADGEPDVFFIHTPTFTAKFIFNENGVPVFESNTGLKVFAYSFYNSANYANSFFIVTDNQGNNYYFDARENSTTQIYGQSVTYPSTWYLTRITTFNSKDDITFSYNTGNSYGVSHNYTIATFDYSCGRSDETRTVTTTINNPQYLSVMQSSAGSVNFTYANDRRDNSDQRLTSIVKKTASGQVIQTYLLNHSYFGDPTTNANLLRLRLDNIQVVGTSAQTATPLTIKTFTYNQAVNLPDRTSKSFDYWGYYNAIQAGDDPFVNPALRAASNIYAQANILNKITDVSGNETNISYELNSYIRPDNGLTESGGGLRVSQIAKSLPAGDFLFTNYSYVKENGQNSGQPYSTVYSNLRVGGIQDYQVNSENPVNVYDINGAFVGYSSVKVTSQNGGYSFSTFTNFSDFPDVFGGDMSVPAATSYAYKRGILKSTVVKNANNEKLSEEINTYTSLENGPQLSVRGINTQYYFYHAGKCCTSRVLGVCVSWYEGSSYARTPSLYSHMKENYRLTQVVHRDYDQLNQARFLESQTNYTYCPDNQLVKTITTSDSRGNTLTKTFYHADDSNIPMLTGAESPVISTLIAGNNLNTVIHETDAKNGVILTQQHNRYGKNDLIGGSKIFLKEVASYNGNTLLNSRFSEYNELNSGIVTASVTGGIPVALQYGYNEIYPVARVSNASAVYAPSQGTATYTITGTGGNFTVDYTGSVTLSLGFVSGTGSCTVQYSVSGPVNQSGYLCRNQGGSGCSYQPGVTFNNMPAGSYYISVYPVSNTLPTIPQTSVIYPKTVYSQQYEFFYEGFEENPSGISGSAHTGKKYYNGTAAPYQVTYVAPNAKSYIIQWWNWNNGKWILNEQSYTGPRTLTGIIDDVRIFPSNAQMTTFTYDPLVGKTSELDPAGISISYQYDGYGRLTVKRDNEMNIVSVTCQNFAGQSIACPSGTSYTNDLQTRSIARNDCQVGQVGTAVTYTVPAAKYTSLVSKDDANQQAINEIDLNGQAYANDPANGSVCVSQGISLVYNNQTAVVWTLTATNNATGTSYPCSLSAAYTGNLCSNLPAGTYTFVFNSGTTALPRPPRLTVNGVVQNPTGTTNVTVTFTGVTVASSPANPFMTIGLQDPASCSFSAAPGFGIATSSISSTSGVASFYIAFYSTSPVSSWYVPVFVATINGGCAPSVQRTFNKTDASGRNWEVQVGTNGQMTLRLLSGTPPGTGNSVYLSGCTYNM